MAVVLVEMARLMRSRVARGTCSRLTLPSFDLGSSIVFCEHRIHLCWSQKYLRITFQRTTTLGIDHARHPTAT